MNLHCTRKGCDESTEITELGRGLVTGRAGWVIYFSNGYDSDITIDDDSFCSVECLHLHEDAQKRAKQAAQRAREVQFYDETIAKREALIKDAHRMRGLSDEEFERWCERTKVRW
jgi:hypothetical protein